MQFTIIYALLALLVIRRIQQSFGFQKYNEVRLIIRVVVFGIIALLLLSGSIIYPEVLFYDGIGIIAGLVLAYFGTKHAKFEKRENEVYFKTHGWVEIIVIALFLIRIIYRIIIIKDIPSDPNEARINYMHDPISACIVFAFWTYYISYFSFILKEGKKVLKEGLGIQTPPKASE